MTAIITSTNDSALFGFLQTYLLCLLLHIIQAYQAQAQDNCTQIPIKLVQTLKQEFTIFGSYRK